MIQSRWLLLIALVLVTATASIKVEEGYWASDADPSKDRYQGRYPWPQKGETKWPGQDDFLQKLDVIEKSAAGHSCGKPRQVAAGLREICYLGIAHSRFEPNEPVSSCTFEYSSPDGTLLVRWPKGYAAHYIGKYNVKPSDDFVRFVDQFEFTWINSSNVFCFGDDRFERLTRSEATHATLTAPDGSVYNLSDDEALNLLLTWRYITHEAPSTNGPIYAAIQRRAEFQRQMKETFERSDVLLSELNLFGVQSAYLVQEALAWDALLLEPKQTRDVSSQPDPDDQPLA